VWHTRVEDSTDAHDLSAAIWGDRQSNEEGDGMVSSPGPGRGLVWLLLAACLALGVAACGDDEGDSDAGSASSGASASTQPADASAGDAKAGSGVTDYVAYTGGKAGKADASLSPVMIGWVNQQGGPADVGPGATKGTELAVKYINEELGGIGGHPLRIKTCFTSTTEEQGQTCGQKMVNDKSISVVSVGAVAIGSQSLVATIGGDKPMVNGVAVGGSDSRNKNGYALFGDALSVSAPFGTFASQVLHARTAAIVYPEIPGVTEAAQAQEQGAKGNGMTVKKVAWNPNATDLVGPLTAAGAQSADTIITSSDPKGCVNLAKALDSLKIDTPVVSQPLCLNVDVVKALGDLPKWTYGIAAQLASDLTDPTAQAYAKVTKAYGMPAQYGQDVWINVTFHEMLTLFKFMNKVGADKLSANAIAEQAKAFKGPLAFGPPTIQCGKYPSAPAICNDQEKFYKYLGQGKFKPASGWLASP
jgi:branched-chain amino acid transport system substrate-binding protein